MDELEHKYEVEIKEREGRQKLPDDVKAEIRFKYPNDTGHIIVKDATFQGNKLTTKALGNGVTWSGFDGNLDTTRGLEFTYELDEDIKGGHTLPFNGITSFQIKEGKVDKSEGFVFEWTGAKIEPNETLILFFTDSKGNPVTMNRILNSADSGFEVTPPLLSNLATGTAQFYAVRKTRIELPEEAGLDGVADLEYYTDAIEVEVVE